jgi:hypothetical protein
VVRAPVDAGLLVGSELGLGLAAGAGLAALLRSLQLVPRAVELPAEVVDRRLSVLDAEMRSRARGLSKELTDPVARAAAREMLEGIAELRWLLRAEGAHLSQPELATVDDELRALARSCLRLAGLATGSVSGTFDPSTEALLERLRAVPAQLTAMKASLKHLRGSTIEKQELALLRVRLGEAQVAIEAARECSLIA